MSFSHSPTTTIKQPHIAPPRSPRPTSFVILELNLHTLLTSYLTTPQPLSALPVVSCLSCGLCLCRLLFFFFVFFVEPSSQKCQ